MLISLQFPIADFRRFIETNTYLLHRPTWPDPDINSEFIRSLGGIKQRNLGGINGWIGEHAVCDAGRAIQIRSRKPYARLDNGHHIPIKIQFRRFYMDGWACGKFDIGLSTKPGVIDTLRASDLLGFFQHCLSFKTTLPSLHGEYVSNELGDSGKNLASLYLHATTKHNDSGIVIPNSDWVSIGTPLLFVHVPADERIKLPRRAKCLIRKTLGLSVIHLNYQWKNSSIPVWILKNFNKNKSTSNARKLRIYLQRLHAEHEVLRRILQKIETGSISPSARGIHANMLQEYLNRAIRHISRLDRKSEKILSSDFGELARSTEDKMSPGRRDVLLEKLRIIDVRHNILHKVQNYSDKWQEPLRQQTIIANEVIMGDSTGDKYIVSGQAGVVGPNGKASNNQFTQDSGGSYDLSKLADELHALRISLQDVMKIPDEQIDISLIKSAEEAAREGDQNSALSKLSKVSNIVLDYANKIGVPIAIAALKKALGL